MATLTFCILCFFVVVVASLFCWLIINVYFDICENIRDIKKINKKLNKEK